MLYFEGLSGETAEILDNDQHVVLPRITSPDFKKAQLEARAIDTYPPSTRAEKALSLGRRIGKTSVRFYNDEGPTDSLELLAS